MLTLRIIGRGRERGEVRETEKKKKKDSEIRKYKSSSFLSFFNIFCLSFSLSFTTIIYLLMLENSPFIKNGIILLLHDYLENYRSNHYENCIYHYSGKSSYVRRRFFSNKYKSCLLFWDYLFLFCFYLDELLFIIGMYYMICWFHINYF